MAYITVADLKAEGLVIGGEAGVEERVIRLIRLASSWIEVATGQWFESREFTADAPMLLDGTGTKTLALHVPIIEIESVTLDDDELDCEEDYVVYNRRSPDDRGNPKIVLTSGRWTKGNQNVALVGSFGYTDLVDGEVVTPEPVKQALMNLVMREMPKVGTVEGQRERRMDGAVSETTDGHSYTLADLALSGGTTGDAYADRVAQQYRAPITCRVL